MNRRKEFDVVIDQVDLEISLLQQQLGHITSALRTAQEHRAALIVRTAPIHRLNDDTLLEIFRIVVQSDFHSSQDVHPSGSPTLLLSQIMHRWRDIVLHAPTLWATFQYAFTSSSDIFLTHLSRSKNATLHIGLVQTRNYNSATRETTILPVLRLLTYRSQYWGHLQIFAHDIDLLRWLPRKLRGIPFPHLRSAILCNSSRSMFVSLHILPSELPMLSSARLSGLHISTLPPMPALRSLHLDAKMGWIYEDHAEVATLALQSPSLESLTILLQGIRPNGRFSTHAPITFPMLKQLSLCSFPGPVIHTGSKFIAPTLETLVLAETQFETADLEYIFRNQPMGSVVYPQLRSLSLIKIELGGAITQATLTALQSLEHLLLNTNHVDLLLDMLQASGMELLPHLRTLELVSGSYTNNCLSSLMATRLATGHPITVINHSVDWIQSWVNNAFHSMPDRDFMRLTGGG